MENDFDKFAENTALFDAYIRGEMPPEERAAFEARLVAEPSLRSDFDLHRALLGSIGRNLERERLREQLREAQKGDPTRRESVRPKVRWRIIALLLLLVAGGLCILLYFWLKARDTAPNESGKTTVHQDSLPAVENINHQSANAPDKSPPVIPIRPKPQANKEGKKAEEPFSPLAGTARPDSFGLAIPISTRTGQSGIIALTVFEYNDGGLWSHRTVHAVQLFVPKNYLDRNAGFRFYELEVNGKSALYLGMKEAFYAVPPGDAELKPEMDAAVQTLLRQF